MASEYYLLYGKRIVGPLTFSQAIKKQNRELDFGIKQKILKVVVNEDGKEVK